MDATDQLKDEAIRLGFDLVGVADAACPKTFPAFERWIAGGMHAGMNYLAERREARRHPESVLPGVRSILMLGVSFARVFNDADRHPVRRLNGIAEYARGPDYHVWCRERLKRLAAKHRELWPNEHCRGAVDTAPILERQFAVDAGLGRIGWNTMLVNECFGTKFFLAGLLSTVRLKPSRETTFSPPCGLACRRCIDACPTKALTEPFVLDARRCLNYWTIEWNDTESGMPSEILEKIGNRFFGCDVCQNVCPANKQVSTIPEGDTDPRALPEEMLRELAVGTPLARKFRRR